MTPKIPPRSQMSSWEEVWTLPFSFSFARVHSTFFFFVLVAPVDGGGEEIPGPPRVGKGGKLKAPKKQTPRTPKPADWQIRLHVQEAKNLAVTFPPSFSALRMSLKALPPHPPARTRAHTV